MRGDLPTPEQLLAEGFARHVEIWAGRREATQQTRRVLRQLGMALSLATSEGHVCMDIADIPLPGEAGLDVQGLRQLLLDSGLVGTPDACGAMPMILDQENRLYLHRYFDYERRLARRLMLACASGTPAADSSKTAVPADPWQDLPQRLAELFPGNDAGTPWPKLAAALALRARLCIISGGPGTGKTSTVVKLLACLIELDPSCRIALAAPTGKAAARMSETIRQYASQLPQAVRDRLPNESFTVHRLLGVTQAGGGFVHHATKLLPIDALVVDEASMLDLALATQLLDAVPESARIILLGDKDQLSAVESGAVFSELSVDPSLSEACLDDLARMTGLDAHSIQAAPPRAASSLKDSVIWLEHNFRFAGDSAIGRLASAINTGDVQQTVNQLLEDVDPGLQWIDDGQGLPTEASMEQMVHGYRPFAEALRQDANNRQAILEAYSRFRVLCAVRDGPRGVVALNTELTRRLRNACSVSGTPGTDSSAIWYPGRPILVLRNDYLLKLFNGDIGITLPDESGALMVYFSESGGGLRAIAPLRLPHHETAYAMTVHKAQGSEFEEVLILLPEPHSRVLTRELLYTAITRARQRVVLCGGLEALKTTITRTTQRHSGLLSRLREGFGNSE